MTKPTEQQKEALAKLAKLTAKDYNLPVDRVAQIFMKSTTRASMTRWPSAPSCASR